MAYDINTALERLEHNLQDLDSAKTQVQNVVAASNDLRQTVSDYVDSISKLYGDIREWEDQLKQTQKTSFTDAQASFEKLKESCEAITTRFKSSTEDTLNKFTDQNSLLARRVEKLSTLREELKASTEQIQDIKKTLSELTRILTESQEGQDRALTNIIGDMAALPVTVKGYTDDVVQKMDDRHSAVIQKIDTASSKIDTIIQKADALATSCSKIQSSCGNLQTSCNNIKASVAEVKQAVTDVRQKVEESHRALSKSININRWIVIICILIAIALHFIKL